MKTRHCFYGLALGLLILTAGCGDEKKAKNLLAETNVDQTALYFMKSAMQSGNKEIAAGKLAQKQATNAQVRNFANMMVTDHTKAAEELLNISDKKLVTPNKGVMPEDKKDIDSLSQLSGAAFDKAYMQLMVKDHELAIKMHNEATDNRINAVQDYAKKQLPALRMHYEEAKKISAALSNQ